MKDFIIPIIMLIGIGIQCAIAVSKMNKAQVNKLSSMTTKTIEFIIFIVLLKLIDILRHHLKNVVGLLMQQNDLNEEKFISLNTLFKEHLEITGEISKKIN